MTSSYGILARHPWRYGRIVRRSATARRGRVASQKNSTSLGTFKDEGFRTVYQSHLMPVFATGTIRSFDQFLSGRSSQASSISEIFDQALRGPPSLSPFDMPQARNWEYLQSFRYNIWHTEMVARIQALPQPASEDSVDNSVPGGTQKASSSDDDNKKRQEKLEHLDRISRLLAENLPTFFTSMHNYALYHKDVVFENRIRGVTTNGINQYALQINKYKILGHLIYSHIRMDVMKITTHPEDNTVRVRWRIQTVGGLKFLQFWKFLTPGWSKELTDYIDGFSTFYVGDEGLIHKHVADKMMPDEQKQSVVAEKLAKLTAFVGFVISSDLM